MTPDINDMRRIRAKEWEVVIFSTLATIGPGTLIIFHFKPQLFLELEIGKLILLSLAITLPMVIANTFSALPDALQNGPLKVDTEELVDLRHLYTEASRIAALCLYAGFAASYFLGLSFKHFCWVVLVVNVMYTAYIWWKFYSKTRSASCRMTERDCE